MLKSLLELSKFIQHNQQIMLEQLHQLCEINSGSYNLQGLQQTNRALQSLFAPLAEEMNTLPPIATTIIDMTGEKTALICGETLFIRKRPELKRRILLCGHMDTVYGIDHPFQKLTHVDANRLNGPGVTDMKGGLIVMLQALNAFEQTPLAHELGWDVVINADEEIGSPSSSIFLDQIANNYQAAFVYEPAMDELGQLAKNRRGSGKFTLVAIGKAAHAGRNFHEGRNAICYLAEIVLAIDALNGTRPGVTINVGKISGGSALNIVPDKAVAKLDVRISQAEDANWVHAKLDEITKKFRRHDYFLSWTGSFHRPVKQVNRATQRLFERIQSIGKQLGLTINWQDSGGCCDGNNLAQHGLPVIDTLGVRGGHIHTPEEFILIDSLAERALLSALLLANLAEGGLEELHD
ncbi:MULTISPECIES: hydrolase [Legionella]|uniref:hydrolase n=1 Tax=Legionella TaxID=445 RepID=UPI00353246AF